MLKGCSNHSEMFYYSHMISKHIIHGTIFYIHYFIYNLYLNVIKKRTLKSFYQLILNNRLAKNIYNTVKIFQN